MKLKNFTSPNFFFYNFFFFSPNHLKPRKNRFQGGVQTWEGEGEGGGGGLWGGKVKIAGELWGGPIKIAGGPNLRRRGRGGGRGPVRCSGHLTLMFSTKLCPNTVLCKCICIWIWYLFCKCSTVKPDAESVPPWWCFGEVGCVPCTILFRVISLFF